MTGPPVRGDVARNTAAARADTNRAFELIQSGRYAAAEPLLRRATEEDPTYGPALNNLGLVEFQLGRYYDAAWAFENAIKLMPREPQPHNNLGLVFETAGKLQDAEREYRQAHELAPNEPEFAGNLARVRIRQDERDDQTRQLLEIVVMNDPRPQWRDWAQFNLTRLRTTATQPSTQPE